MYVPADGAVHIVGWSTRRIAYKKGGIPHALHRGTVRKSKRSAMRVNYGRMFL
jgi:hypothetical protein